jgi:hypothetical protein
MREGTMPNGGRSHAGGDAVFRFLRICRHGLRFELGILPPPEKPADFGDGLTALYRRVQVASPPPTRADGREWEFGIFIPGGMGGDQPLPPDGGDGSWKEALVYSAEDIASLGQPDPDTIVLDAWLTVPADVRTLEFDNEPDHLGFLSAPYPQPEFQGGKAQVRVQYFDGYDIDWSHPGRLNNWVAISFDRFWPPERESVEFIGQVQERCDCDQAPAAQDQAVQATAGSA